jgi:hypothetical protein
VSVLVFIVTPGFADLIIRNVRSVAHRRGSLTDETVLIPGVHL